MEQTYYSITTANDLSIFLEFRQEIGHEQIGGALSLTSLQHNGGIIAMLCEKGKGIPLMVDSGAYSLYNKIQKVNKLPEKDRQVVLTKISKEACYEVEAVNGFYGGLFGDDCGEEYKLTIKFGEVMKQYELLAKRLNNPCTFVAPDVIGDPAATKTLQMEYLPLMNELSRKYGAKWIIPCQKPTAAAIAETYQFILENKLPAGVGIPMAVKMNELQFNQMMKDLCVYFIETLSPEDGIFTHFLGLGHTGRITEILNRMMLVAYLKKFAYQLSNFAVDIDWMTLLGSSLNDVMDANTKFNIDDLDVAIEEVISQIIGNWEVTLYDYDNVVNTYRMEKENEGIEVDDTEEWPEILAEYYRDELHWDEQTIDLALAVQGSFMDGDEIDELLKDVLDDDIKAKLASVDSSKIIQNVIHCKRYNPKEGTYVFDNKIKHLSRSNRYKSLLNEEVAYRSRQEINQERWC